MGYKKLRDTVSFADLAVRKSLEHNRSLKIVLSQLILPVKSQDTFAVSRVG
jgi:hypothetical protein